MKIIKLIASIGAVSDTKSPVFESRQIFFTSTGRIGVLSTIENSEYALKLTGLQRNMEKIMFGTGKLDHLRCAAAYGKVVSAC